VLLEPNPYRPPIATPVCGPDEPRAQVLATPHSRMLAVVLDETVLAVVLVALLWQLGMLDTIERIFEDDLDAAMTTAGLGILVWLAIQLPFLWRGQTLGKRIIGLRMVDHATGEPAALGRLLLLRYLPFMIAGCVPLVGRIILLTDLTMLSRRSRRCLHDLLAGTKVVET
jgi:uncharacterized RDD family membrane protein YckC